MPHYTVSPQSGATELALDCQNNKKTPCRSKSHSVTPMQFAADIVELPNKPDARFRSKEFVERITCHGILDWYGSNSKPSFIFWGSVFLIALGILIYCVVQCFIEFYTNPIQTSIQVVPSRSLPFPDITICPANFIDRRKFANMHEEAMQRIQLYKSAGSQKKGVAGMFSKLSSLIPIRDGPKLEFRTNGTTTPPPIPELVEQQEEILFVSFDTAEFIRECSYQGNKCTSTWISRTIDTDLGVCYLIQPSEGQRTPNKGLILVLDLHTEKEPRGISITDYVPTDGVTVRAELPRQPVSYGGVLVSPGYYTKLSLASTEEEFITVTKFSKTPQVCFNDDDADLKIMSAGNPNADSNDNTNIFNDEIKLGLNAKYTQELCDFDCVQQMVFSNPQLECLLPVDVAYIKPEYLTGKQSTFCKNTSMLVDQVENNATFKQELDNCRSTCEQECHRVSFNIRSSSQPIPSTNIKSLTKSLRSKRQADTSDGHPPIDNSFATPTTSSFEHPVTFDPNGPPPFPFPPNPSTMSSVVTDESPPPREDLLNQIDRWQSNVIILDISFDKLSTTKISQSPSMTLNTLLSNLGGVSGLWLGASLFTLLQGLVFLLKLCYTACTKKED